MASRYRITHTPDIILYAMRRVARIRACIHIRMKEIYGTPASARYPKPAFRLMFIGFPMKIILFRYHRR